MPEKFLAVTGTPSVRAARAHYYGAAAADRPAPEREVLGPEEIDYIGRRDSFYLATVSETGWPYVQHRGGRPGFLRVLAPDRLAFADYKGNRQLLSTGNLAGNDRVTLFLMDYPRRQRLKIIGRARTVDARAQPELLDELAEPALHRVTERFFLVDVAGYDWNCPKYITPRYTAEEIAELTAPLRQRITQLEAQLATRQP